MLRVWFDIRGVFGLLSILRLHASFTRQWRFGAVGISGAHALIGSWRDGDAGTDAGSAYTFAGLTDCNANGTLDACDIAIGTSPDANGNGVPDECDPAPCPGDRTVNLTDLGILLGNFNTGMTLAEGDLNNHGTVNLTDLGILLANYGVPCP